MLFDDVELGQVTQLLYMCVGGCVCVCLCVAIYMYV